MSNPTAMNGQSQQQATSGESIQAQQFQPRQFHEDPHMASQVYHGPAVNTRDANSGNPHGGATLAEGVAKPASGESIQAQQFQPGQDHNNQTASQVSHGPTVNLRPRPRIEVKT
ncbi:hypothetical protein V8E54_001617 [Elaphomyces granulatus]